MRDLIGHKLGNNRIVDQIGAGGRGNIAMFGLRIVCVALVLIIFFPAHGLAASDGVYEGVTSQGYFFSLTVSGGEITEYSIRFACNASNTPETNPRTVYGSCAIAGDGSFACGTPQPFCPSASYAVVFEVVGTFSGTSVSGSFDLAYQPNSPFPGACCYRYGITFTASVQSPSPQISIGDVTVTEGDTGTTMAQLDVTLSFGVNEAVTVDWETTDGTADTADYASASGTTIFSAQQTTKTIDVTVYGDSDEETDEIFYVDLSNPTNAGINDSRGQCTITDDDIPPAETLYDQTDNGSASGKVAQDFEPADDDWDCEAADDFTVPAGGWRIERVELSGHYSDGGGPAEGVHLGFHQDQDGWPGETAVCTYSGIVPTSDDAGSPTPGMIVVDLPTDCVLSPGAHWLVAQIRMDYAPRGSFYWSLRTAQNGSESVWRNPGDAYGSGFTDWTRMTETIPGDTEPDLIFLLAGGDVLPLFTDGFELGDCRAWSTTVGESP